MPTNYTANPSATQSPAPTPDAGSPPILSLPVDGDALDAASIGQALKALADFSAFGQAPFANPSAWGQPVVPFYNAKKQLRSYIAHAGVPAGRWFGWEESWVPQASYSLGPGSSTVGRWSFEVDASGTSGTSPQAPGAGAFNPWNTSKALVLSVDGSGTHRAEMRTEATAKFTDDCYIRVDIDFSLLSILDVDWVIGLSSTGENINSINNGLFLIRPDSAGTNYLLRSISGGTDTEVDSGIIGTANVPHHLTLEWWGANLADDSAGHAILTLDAFQADITSNLPNGLGNKAELTFGGFITTSPVTNPTMAIGTVKYQQYLP